MSWSKTLSLYLQKALDVRRGSVVVLPDAPRHVPVLCLDLEYMIGELHDFEAMKLALAHNRQPNDDPNEVIGRLLVGLRGVEGALGEITSEMEAALAMSPRQRDLLPLVWNLRNALAALYAAGPDGTHQWATLDTKAHEALGAPIGRQDD